MKQNCYLGNKALVLFILCVLLASCGGGTMGTGLSYGSGSKGGKLARLTVIDIVGTVSDANGDPIVGAEVSVETPHSSYTVETDSTGSFTTSATYASGEPVNFRVVADNVRGAFVDKDPPLDVSYGQISLKALTKDHIRSEGIK